MNQPPSHAFKKTALYIIFYAILKWHRNGYKQNNINWQHAITLSVTIAAASKMEMSSKKIDDAGVGGGLLPPIPPGLYAYVQDKDSEWFLLSRLLLTSWL